MGRSIRGAQKYDDFGNRLADDARSITNAHTSAPTTAAGLQVGDGECAQVQKQRG